MPCNHYLPGFVLFVELFVVIDLLLLELVAVVLLVIHMNTSVLEFLDRNIVLDEPITIIFQINDVIYGNVQEPNHNIKTFLINFHYVEYPN